MTAEENQDPEDGYTSLDWVAVCAHQSDGVQAVICGHVECLPLVEDLHGDGYFYKDGGAYQLIADQLSKRGWDIEKGNIVDDVDDSTVTQIVNMIMERSPAFYYVISRDDSKWLTKTPPAS